MKKRKFIGVVALILVASIFVSGCGKVDVETTGTGETNKKTVKAKDVKMGDSIELKFLKMTLDTVEVKDDYQFEYTEETSYGHNTKMGSIEPKSGMKLVTLRGTITNLNSVEIHPYNNFILGEFVINGNKYKTQLKFYNVEHAENISDLTPQQSADYFLYAEVPENVANDIKTNVVTFGFSKDTEKYAMDLSDLDYLYKLKVK